MKRREGNSFLKNGEKEQKRGRKKHLLDQQNRFVIQYEYNDPIRSLIVMTSELRIG